MALINAEAFPWAWILGGLGLAYIISTIFFDPLSDLPGPFWARWSPLWLTLQSRRLRRSQAIYEAHQRYGEIIRIAPRHVSINRPTALKEVYGFNNGLTKGPFYENNDFADFFPPFDKDVPTLFSALDPRIHKQRRKYLAPAFSSRFMKEFEPIMSHDILNLKKILLELTSSQQSSLVDMSKWLNFLAYDVIGDFSYGQPFGFLDSQADPQNMTGAIDARLNVVNALGTLPIWLHGWMKYFIFDKFWYEGLQASNQMVSVGIAAFNARKTSKNSDRKDLLSFMFSARDAETNLPMEEYDIIAEASSLIIGGSDTTSSTMIHFVDFVSRDLELQHRLQSELDNTFGGEVADDWIPSDAVTSQLPLLNATLREVLRVRPTSATGLERLTPREGVHVAQRWIPGKTLVSVPTFDILRNPDIYKNPYTFDPDRWLVEDTTQLDEFYFPFSLGPRGCIGQNFAMMEMTKTLAMLFMFFEITRESTAPTKLTEGFFLKATECRVTIKRRDQRGRL